jgi:thiol-disulfide isomerase/thioredoxin
MKKLFIILLGTLQFIFSCNNVDSFNEGKSASTNTTDNIDYIVNREEVLKSFMSWYKYTYNNIKLSDDFAGLDIDSSIIKKADFLHRLATGKFVPIKVMKRDNVNYYRLYKLTNPNSDIEGTVKEMALTESSYYALEGIELPAYNFIDLDGKEYNNTNTKGKIVVLKCWFIHCVACVKEFPELNKLVKRYKIRNDIQFVSLAWESKQQLTSFLKSNEFLYVVVPNTDEKYMREQLHVTSYPTHILIDKNGKVVKVVNAISDLVPYIDKEANKEFL